MTQAWAPEQAKIDVGDAGDILSVLRRVYDKYLKHMERIATRAAGREFTDKENRGLMYYGNSAITVKKLIEQ